MLTGIGFCESMIELIGVGCAGIVIKGGSD